MLTHTCVIPIPCPTFPYITLPYIGCITYIYHLYIGQTLYLFIYLVIYWFIYMCVCVLPPPTSNQDREAVCNLCVCVEGSRHPKLSGSGSRKRCCHLSSSSTPWCTECDPPVLQKCCANTRYTRYPKGCGPFPNGKPMEFHSYINAILLKGIQKLWRQLQCILSTLACTNHVINSAVIAFQKKLTQYPRRSKMK
jgi:hypothetical protein